MFLLIINIIFPADVSGRQVSGEYEVYVIRASAFEATQNNVAGTITKDRRTPTWTQVLMH